MTTMLEKAINEMNEAGELDHPNIAKTFVRFGDEHYVNPIQCKTFKISEVDFKFKTSKLYSMQSLGDLGRIAETTGESSEDVRFILADKVKMAVLQEIEGKDYAPFCVSETEKICQFIFADVA